jgi:hypothetical protein
MMCAALAGGCRQREVPNGGTAGPAVEIKPRDAASQPSTPGVLADAAADALPSPAPGDGGSGGAPRDAAGEAAGPGEGLVLQLRLDEAAGSVRAADSSGRGNDGMLVGAQPASAWIAGKKGRALSLAGGGHLVVASSVSLNGIFRAFTAAAFVQISGTPAGRSTIIARQGAYALGLAGGRPYLSVTVEGRPAPIEVAAAEAVPAQGWVHVAGVFDAAGAARLFLDGKEVGALPIPGSIGNSLAPLTAGARLQGAAVAEPLTGGLDEVRLYSRALAAAEIGQLISEP